jgi:iron complex outermembrane receptor protein
LQYERNTVRGLRIAPLVAGDGIPGGHNPISGYRSTDDVSLTGKAGLQYTFSRHAQAYATYTRGYKGKGYDSEITADFAGQNPVKPEYANAYEIGFKGSTLDNRLSLAAALFWTDYTNLQITANRSDPNTGTILYQLTNAGTSSTKGVELEGTFRPSRHFSVSASAQYAKARVNVDGLSCPLQVQASAAIYARNFPVNACYIRQYTNAAGATVTTGALQDVRNGRLPYSPDWRLSISPRYENSLGGTDYDFFVAGNVNWQSNQTYAIEQDPLLTQKAFALVDASVGVHRKDGRYSASLFVKNLFNQNYTTTLYHGGYIQTSTAKPNDLYGFFNKDSQRFFGGSIGVKF